MAADFEVDSQMVGPLPMINAFTDRLGLRWLLETFLPHNDARLKLAPATAATSPNRRWLVRSGKLDAPSITATMSSALPRYRCETTLGLPSTRATSRR